MPPELGAVTQLWARCHSAAGTWHGGCVTQAGRSLWRCLPLIYICKGSFVFGPYCWHASLAVEIWS